MSFTIKDYDLRNCFQTERKLLMLAGFYPSKQKRKFLYSMSAFMNLLISYGQLLTMIIQMGIDRNDLSKLTQSFSYFSTHSIFLCKLYNFGYYKDLLLEIEDSLTDPVFYGFTHDRLKVIKNKIRGCDFIATAYRIVVSSTVTFLALVPFIDETRKMTLPLPGWLPYDTTRWAYYLPTAFVQSFSIVISAYCNTGIDIITWKMISLAAAQFEILKQNLSAIDYTAGSGQVKEDLVKCIRHHKKTVELTKQVQTVFSKGMFLQFFASVIVICTTSFQLIVVPIPSVAFVSLITYFCGMTCQVATYCWYGNDVITTSDKIGEALYMSNWDESDNKIRKIVLIFLEKTKKPVSVRAGNFITLSLTTFTQIMRSAYSYFAVLQRLYADNL